MWIIVIRFAVAGAVVVAVTEFALHSPRLGALVLTLPIISIVAFIFVWFRLGDLTAVSLLARETLVLLPLGLPFFVPLAFAERLGLGFWSAFCVGIALACTTVGGWLWFGRAK